MPSMPASECQCSSNWAFSWNLNSHFLCMVSWWDGCWGCSCSAVVDLSGTASSVLFVGSVRPVYCVATVWVSFKFVSVSQDSCVCCHSASSVCVSPFQQRPSHWAVQQVQVVSRKREQLCVHILNCHKNPALKYFNIATAQRPREAMQIFIWINDICSRDTGLCSRWKCVEY